MGKKSAAVEWNTTPIIRERAGAREAVEAEWGLVPFWWRRLLSERAFDSFNARIERVRDAKSYRHALEDQRCIIPARNFYEFTGPKGSKTRLSVSIDGQPLLMAGLWDYNKGLDLLSFTIITTEPGPRFREYHHRVPAILPDGDAVETFMTGNVEEVLAIAGKDNDELLQVQPA